MDRTVNERLETTDGRSVLRIERRLAHPPEMVWRAITEPRHLSQWFPSDVEMDLRVGGRVRFVFREGEGPTLEGVIRELNRPNIFVFTWADSVLRWELRAHETGSVLVFTQIFDDRVSAASFAAGWSLCLDGLDSVLRGGPVDRSLDQWAGRHERYVDQFGLGQGQVEDRADGWVVRFERQLTRGVDDVWARLSGSDGPGPAVGGLVPVGFTNPSVAAGRITAAEPPELIEYDWPGEGRPVGRVRWQLTPGNGGAHLTLTQTGPEAAVDQRSAALASWHDHIEVLAKSLLEVNDRR
jgi:uncharacterized protein YndB with AHSA1/START domain